MPTVTKPEVWDAIIACLRELMEEQEQDLGDVNQDTYLGADLGISSIDTIHLLVALEDRFERPLSFDELASLPDGQFRKDLKAGELLEFACSKLSGQGNTALID